MSCPSARSSTMVVKVGVCVVERVNVLSPSGYHWHCPGMASEKDVVGTVAHHVQQPSDRSCHRPCSSEEMVGVSVSRNCSLGPRCRWLPFFYMV
jgi:hypothetical protein